MPSEEIRAKVKAVLAREWNIQAESIPDTAAINEFPHWDSLGHITIMLALENEFGIEVNSETVQKLLSINNIVEYIMKKKPQGEDS